jgi:sedoheptulokinase
LATCTIGIDIGSTSTKGVLYDVESKEVLRLESNSLRPIIQGLPEGRYEEAPEPLREAAYDIIEKLANYATTFSHQVKAICFTGQMHGGLLVDEKLKPLTNFVTWQDKRGDESIGGKPLAQSIRERINVSEREGIGTEIHTGFLGVTAASWKREGKLTENARIIGIYDWIASSIVGRLVSDPSSVAAWGLYNIKEKRVSLEAVEACGIASLPEIIDVGEVIGPISPIGPIGHINELADAVFVSGMGDTQASYIGSGCKPDEILLNCGTGSQLMIETDTFGRYWGTDTRYLGAGKYLIVAPTLAGGKAYAILADFFIDVLQSFDIDVSDRDSIYERMNELARSSSNGINFSPFFLGSRTHGESERASIRGVDANNFTASSITRALIEGMIAEVKEPYDTLPEELRKHTALLASGNGMRRNAALRSVAENAFGLPLRLSNFEEEAALGAAITAAKAVS